MPFLHCHLPGQRRPHQEKAAATRERRHGEGKDKGAGFQSMFSRGLAFVFFSLVFSQIKNVQKYLEHEDCFLFK